MPDFYPLLALPVSYEVLIWSSVIGTLIPQSFANSPYLENVIPVNLNSGSFPLKNILNDIISAKSRKGIQNKNKIYFLPKAFLLRDVNSNQNFFHPQILATGLQNQVWRYVPIVL